MFKKLRNQLVIMHMGVVSLIIMLFFGAILIFENEGINRSISDMFSREHTIGFTGDAVQGPGSMLAFHVTVTDTGEVADVISPYMMSERFVAESVKKAISKSAIIGRIKCQEQHLAYKNNGNHIVFIYINREIAMFERLVNSFYWIATPLLLVIFLASLYFAKLSIRPIETAFIKQKEFIADASHELKTPLATISANADVLLQGSDEHSIKWATYIKAETVRMASLVESLLYLAKIDYLDARKSESVLCLGEVLNEVLLPLEAVIYEKKIDLKVDCAEGVMIKGDKTQIYRLLGILIDNAVKYTSGEISIEIENLSSRTQITVQNSGAPIPPEKLCDIFNRFYRVDESHKYTGGFGLGLAIAKAIVDRHNGEIACSSDKIDGTKFIVTI